MSDPRRRRAAPRERDYEEWSEEELVDKLRRSTWSWLQGIRPVHPEPEPELPPAPPAPPPDRPEKRRRTKREPIPEAVLAFRKASFLQLKPAAPEKPEKQTPARKPRVKREPIPEAVAAFRKASFLQLKPAAPEKPEKQTPARKPRGRREALPEAVLAFRKASFLQLRPKAPAVEKKAPAVEKKAPDLAKTAPAPPPPPPPPPKRRVKREVIPDGVLDLRRRAWAWFAPRATGEAAAGHHVAARAPAPVEAGPGGEVVRSHLKGVLEALIFASEHPLPAKELARLAKADLKVVKSLLTELVEEYHPRGFRLDEVAGGYVFRTSPLFAPFVREQVAKKPVKMSRAQIETLAIVAYRQPITRPEVDEVRGVDSGAVLKSLLERELVRIIGKKDEPGRPMLYGTTGSFLEFFGLKALGDLPTLREFTELTDESRRAYEREMGEEPPEDGSTPADTGLMGGEGDLRRAPAPTAEELENDPTAPEEPPPPEPTGGAEPAPANDDLTEPAGEGEARDDEAEEQAPESGEVAREDGEEDDEDEDEDDEDDEDEDDEDDDEDWDEDDEDDEDDDEDDEDDDEDDEDDDE